MASIQVSPGRNLGKFLKSYRSQNIGDSFPVSVPFSATGGDYVLTPGNGYKYHTFTSSGSFVTEGGPHTVEYILVAGGGGGGGCTNSKLLVVEEVAVSSSLVVLIVDLDHTQLPLEMVELDKQEMVEQ